MKTARRRGSNRTVPVHTARKVICKYEGPPAPPIKLLDTIDPIEIRMVLTIANRKVLRPIPVYKFEVALDCSGSFLLHFSLDKKTEEGVEGRRLLMAVLEPLLGEDVEYSDFLSALNNYLQSKHYKTGVSGQTENMKTFIHMATSGWKKPMRIAENLKRKIM